MFLFFFGSSLPSVCSGCGLKWMPTADGEGDDDHRQARVVVEPEGEDVVHQGVEHGGVEALLHSEVPEQSQERGQGHMG
ncbi:MAG: hypothetical protein GY737_25370, partial [Desulfobacteraceae bacterium]|nr:hypothetical protein [Desulfobacteraceae bacterium]